VKRLSIRFVRFTDQRFTTLGDWLERDDQFEINVTIMPRWQHTFLILMHELIEWAVCQRDGVKTAVCDGFDTDWERELADGKHRIEEEAGFDRRCPYREGHVWGARAERFLCWLLGCSWKEYLIACDEAISGR
jgi:hypothetical protein